MLSYAIKLHLEASVKPQGPVITVKQSLSAKGELGRVAAVDRLKVDLNINVPGLKAKTDEIMQMDCILHFKNQQELTGEITKAIAQFEGDARVAGLRSTKGYKLDFSLMRADFVHETPDFVVDVIHELQVKIPSLNHSIPQKQAALTAAQKIKLAQTHGCVQTQKTRNAANQANWVTALSGIFWLSIGYILFSTYLPEALSPYLFITGVSAILAKYALYKLLDKHAQRYEEIEASSTSAKTKQYEAYLAGKTSALSVLFKHWRHPLAFLAGQRMMGMKEQAIIPEAKSSHHNHSSLSKEAIEERRDKCYEAALKRIPVVIHSATNKKVQKEKPPRKNQKRACRR